MIKAVVLDLDGVIRHFDAEFVADVERRHALEQGSIMAAMFSEPGLTDVTTGRITREAWVSGIGERLGAPGAAAEWGSQVPHVDPEMLELCDELRARGLTVAVLTNGTDRISAEVAEQGIACRVDHVFNSAEIGHAKPDRRAFDHVLDALGLEGREVFFADDSPAKLAGADEVGMHTHAFVGRRELRQELARLGVIP
ncbi:MAG TPA: HAD family phosphatase [Acidimicrobiales bacterium]|nr:HAD family phosphatase [Acidimicrobiales bacterium]